MCQSQDKQQSVDAGNTQDGGSDLDGDIDGDTDGDADADMDADSDSGADDAGGCAQYDGSTGELEWVKSAGGTGTDRGYGVAVASDMSSVIVGSYHDEALFGKGEQGETILTSEGGPHVFLASYNADGVLLWAKSAIGLEIEGAHGVDVYSDGSVAVTGRYMAQVVFGEGEANETVLTSEGYGDGGSITYDIFLAYYQKNGMLVWAKRAGGRDEDYAEDVAIGPDGSIYVGGKMEGTATFGPGESNETVLEADSGKANGFVAKYDRTGKLLWAAKDDSYEVNAISVLADGSVVATGVSIVTSMYDPAGSRVWSSKVPLHPEASCGEYGCQLHSETVTALPDGSCIISGFVRGAAIFGEGEDNETVFESLGDHGDIFLTKYGPEGDLVWVQGAHGSESNTSRGIVPLSNGDLVLGGQFKGTLSLGRCGENDEIVLQSQGERDMFLARYDAQGKPYWGWSAGGPAGDYIMDIDVSGNGDILATGVFQDGAVFNQDSPAETLASEGWDDVFLFRFSP